MLRSSLVGPFCLVSVLLSDAARACPILSPDREALVDVGLSSIRTPLWVAVYDRDGEDPYCEALLDLDPSALPSRSIVPRPREIAAEVAPVAKALGAKNCEIIVWEMDRNADFGAVDEECYRGEFRYDGASWWAVDEDTPCW